MATKGLLDIINTKEQQTELINQLDEFNRSLFQTKESLDEKMERIFSARSYPLVKGMLEEHKLDSDNPSGIQQVITKLRKDLEVMPTVSLELAVEPSEKMVKTIHAWFSASLPQKYLLEIRVNPKLVGALSITVNGRFKDYSLKKTLQSMDVLQQNNQVT